LNIRLQDKPIPKTDQKIPHRITIPQKTTGRLCHTSVWENILIPEGLIKTGWQSGSGDKSLKEESYRPPDYIVKQSRPTMGFSEDRSLNERTGLGRKNIKEQPDNQGFLRLGRDS
jgi:hypothetical protein